MFKILVVEDDRDLNRTVCAFLNRSGYEATGCLNAVDAYDAMYETMFDLMAEGSIPRLGVHLYINIPVLRGPGQNRRTHAGTVPKGTGLL